MVSVDNNLGSLIGKIKSRGVIDTAFKEIRVPRAE